jgi:lysophospholipase L1-like esterase
MPQQFQAVSGYTIDQAKGLLQDAVADQPNVISINAGVNDMDQNLDIPNAANRMSSLLDYAFQNIPGTTVLLSTLPPSTKASLYNNTKIYNADLRTLVKKRQGNGDRVVLADMDTGTITTADLSDDRHPNDGGYKKMGDIFYAAFQTGYQLGFLRAPRSVSGKSDSDYTTW